MLIPPTGTTETTGYGRCPLARHPAAAVALTAGDATAVARLVAGAAAVAVLPRICGCTITVLIVRESERDTWASYR
jgi:hypothetical protein